LTWPIAKAQRDGFCDCVISNSYALSLSSACLVAYASCAGVLLRKYNDAESNIMELKRLETTILHGVDVKTMKFHTDLKNRRFDRIVFNFPHAGLQGPEDQVKMIKYEHHLVIFFRHLMFN
jgi:25S rRNA (uracil2634-N3)-methyltransferase